MGAETPDNLEISSGVIKLFNSPLNQRSIVSTITASRVATLSILAVLVENKDGILGIFGISVTGSRITSIISPSSIAVSPVPRTIPVSALREPTCTFSAVLIEPAMSLSQNICPLPSFNTCNKGIYVLVSVSNSSFLINVNKGVGSRNSSALISSCVIELKRFPFIYSSNPVLK